MSPGDAELVETALKEMERLGAEIVDPANIPTAQELEETGFDVLLYEFKVGITFLGDAFSELTLIKLAYSYEQATILRRPPASTPPLLGDTKPVPEPGTTVAFTVFGLSAIGLKLFSRRKIQSH